MKQPYLIVGGDAAGMSAASKIKRTLPDVEVIVYERGPHISYSACGLPYWIGGSVTQEDKLIVLTPQKARERRGIDVQIGCEVTAIDPKSRKIHIRDVETEEPFSQGYEKLVISTGASPVAPAIQGLDNPAVFMLRTLHDGQAIHRWMAEHQPQRAAIIGGGYIGVEMAEGLQNRGLDVALFEMADQILPNFDAEIVEEVTPHLQEKQVCVYTQSLVSAIEQDHATKSLRVSTSHGVFAADLVLVTTGVAPNSGLAAEAGLRIGETGAIWTDVHMQTSDSHIYAAGDCVEHLHLVTQRPAWIPLATSASKGGRVAGANAAGEPQTLPGILGTTIVKVFDYTLACTGLTVKEAAACDLIKGVGAVTTSSYEIAYYWQNAGKCSVKLIFDKDGGRVVGGQIVGKEGVKGRIDVIATAITAQMTVEEMGDLDLAYAPPYSPTYDPIHIAANVATRQLW